VFCFEPGGEKETNVNLHITKKLFLIGCIVIILPASYAGTKPAIYIAANASPKVQLAAKEVRRYVYITTGSLPEIRRWKPGTIVPDVSFLLFTPAEAFSGLPRGVTVPAPALNLRNECYWIKSMMRGGKKTHLIVGGDEIGLLYGAYAFAEQLGVRFYLDGDVLPDRIVPVEDVSVAEKTGTPLFDIRGIQPFHDFPEGPDWWTSDDYKAVFSQILRLKMNFFGLHTYPEGGIGPEPLVWIGPKEDLGSGGNVKTAYPARHFTNVNGTWGFKKRLTSEYSNRMGDLFDADIFGTSYMKGIDGWPAGVERENALFDTVSGFFHDVFTYAREIGIRTCVGTETPLVVPARVSARLAAKGINSGDSATTQLLYEGMFEWVKKHYPVDYYWFWTPEDWTWRENTPEELRKTRVDLESAIRAAQNVKSPFTLATCGWVLGPVNDRSYFDRFLPKTWPMSCINRYVGFEPIEEGFTRTEGRPLWAIPWLEDDPGLSQPQLWAGRMRRDAVDAAAYGCTGLIGIHWRTRILGPNVSALASAAWEQPWNPHLGLRSSPESASERKKTMNLDFPVGDFYRDWAKCNFGGDSSDAIAAIFSGLDGGPVFAPSAGYRTWVPRPADWLDGPGGIRTDTLTWQNRKGDYRFVDRLEELRNGVTSGGARDRFDYWLNMFRYLRAAGKFSCTGGEIKRLSDGLEKEPAEKRANYWDRFVSLRKQQIGELEEALTFFLRTVSTRGELGTVANWQQHIRDVSLERPAARIENLMGKPLPDECRPSGRLLDVRRMIIPTVRNTLRKGESLNLEALFYGPSPGSVVIKWRALGRREFESLDFKHFARNVYSVLIPSDRIRGDFEYCVEAVGNAAGHQVFPPTAPGKLQTVVVF
jgi:hypothetical protein